ncbi:MAG: hypothetical protein U5L72_20195 [Bacteroidales bacterium]|nr:hypothetical protein [Bacteroidales bacterium]
MKGHRPGEPPAPGGAPLSRGAHPAGGSAGNTLPLLSPAVNAPEPFVSQHEDLVRSDTAGDA